MENLQANIHLERLPRTVELVRCGDRARLRYVDERALPGELVMAEATSWRAVVDAIGCLAVRGAPALGVAGAAAVALWADELVARERLARAAGPRAHAGADARGTDRAEYAGVLARVADEVASARPTAVNLRWGVERAMRAARSVLACGEASRQAPENLATSVAYALFSLVKEMEAADEADNRAIGAAGANLLLPGSRVLTHCNAGSLATVFYGTALGVVYAAAARRRVARVFACETRPVDQGARLTAWELARAGVPATVLCDSMAASLMARGAVDAVIVGADRIAANGDVANKVGTYGLAVLAREHGVPFYVAAPVSTIDPETPDGASIPIEERPAQEVMPTPIEGVEVWNPAFDVTPARLVTAVVTEQGVVAPDQAAGLARRRLAAGA